MTQQQVIPEAAVEAAARIIYRDSGRKRVMSYRDAKEACEADARDILEAAAPHMLTEAKADAWDECMASLVDEDGTKVEVIASTNPYRSQA